MARGDGKTPTRPIRVDLDLWARFGEAIERQDEHLDRSKVLREFMAWYTRDQGAKLPKRPDVV